MEETKKISFKEDIWRYQAKSNNIWSTVVFSSLMYYRPYELIYDACTKV